MSDRLQKTLIIIGIILAIIGIVFNKNSSEVYLNITIILWITNTYITQKQLDKLENRK